MTSAVVRPLVDEDIAPLVQVLGRVQLELVCPPPPSAIDSPQGDSRVH